MGAAAEVRSFVSPHAYNELAKLPEDKQSEVVRMFMGRKKDKSIGLVTAILGVHYFYLQKWALALLFLISCGGFLIWWFIDLFRVGKMIEAENDKILLDSIASMR